MSDFDWLDLDARSLRLLATVEETGSITAAAERLDVTQSAVSHLVAKLRLILRDDLFVKSGRGIRPTPRASALARRARELLRDMEAFAQPELFRPELWRATFTIAANDFQRDVLLPELARRLREQAPGLALRIIPSNIPSADMLRLEHCDLVVSPRPPPGNDLRQSKLFDDRFVVYYDPARRAEPASLAEYLDAEHVTVVYEPHRALDFDAALAARGLHRRFRVTVPGFAGLYSFVRGSDFLATAPSLLRMGVMRGLATAALPVSAPRLPMYMIWSERRHDDPGHRWLRAELAANAKILRASVAPRDELS